MEIGRYYLDKTTGELRLGNKKFYQFYVHNFKVISQLQRDFSTAVTILFFIIEHMELDNALVISQKALSEVLGISRSTVYRNVEILKNSKIIRVLKTGNSNIYVVNADVVWRKSAEQKKFALFNAKVYLTPSEQDEIKKPIKTYKRKHAEIRYSQKKLPKTDASSAGDDNSPGIGPVR